MVTGKQILAARALLGLSEDELADRAGVSISALQSIESSSEDGGDQKDQLQSIRTALESAGVTFIDERATSSAGGVGIRFSAPQSSSIDSDVEQTVQYPEMAKNGPFGAGG